MAGWIFFLTNPISMIILCCTMEVVHAVLTRSGTATLDFPLAQRMVAYVALVSISSAAHYKLVFTNESKPSMVDITPMAALNTGQINMLEDVVMQFESNGLISDFENYKISAGDGSTGKVYRFFYGEADPAVSLDVKIRFYESEQKASERFIYEKSKYEKRMQHMSVASDNGTQAIMYHSYRTNNAFHSGPSTKRRIKTDILVGSANILLDERIERKLMHMNRSSIFIEWLCGMLENEELKKHGES